MRLIDADKLQRTEGIFTYRFTDDTDILSCCAYRYEDIETAPTINAIPIKWLIENAREYFADFEIAHLDCMITDWRLQNEID